MFLRLLSIGLFTAGFIPGLFDASLATNHKVLYGLFYVSFTGIVIWSWYFRNPWQRQADRERGAFDVRLEDFASRHKL